METLDRGNRDGRHQGHHEQAVAERGQRLAARQPVAVPARCRPLGEAGREDGETDGRTVGQHVAGIAEQGERSGIPAGDRLDGREAEGQDQCADEARTGFDRMGVRMPMTVAMGMIMGVALARRMIVRRVINGQTRRFVEEMSLPFTAMDPDAEAHEANHLFAALRVSVETPVSEISVPHLAGKTVHVWSNEGAFPDLVVSSPGGTVQLPGAVTHAWVGLFDATHELITLDVQAASPNGDTTGRQKRLKDIAVSFARTAQARIAVVEVEPQRRTELRERPLIQMPVAAPLTEVISGVVNTGGVSGTARELQVVVRPFSGAPVTITSIVPVVEEAGR